MSIERIAPAIVGAGLTLLVMAGVVACSGDSADSDGADSEWSELETRVDELIADVDESPTSQANAGQRAALLWQWANRFALDGGVLPVDLSVDVADTMNAGDGVPIPKARLAAIDGYVRELAAKSDSPDLLGALEFDQRGPLAAAGWATVELAWTVGTGGMREGGVVLFGRERQSDHTRLQNTSAQEGGWVTVRTDSATSSDDVQFEPITMSLGGTHGGRVRPEEMPSFRLARGELRPGDRVVFTLGDRSGGGPGLRVQTFSTDRLLVPVFLALEEGGVFFTPEWPALQVVGGEPVAIGVVAPSVVEVGEPFELSIRVRDRWFNRAVAEMPPLRVYLDGDPVGEIGAGRDALHLSDGLVIEEPGVHRFLVVAADGSIEGESNPIWVEAEVEDRVFWGDIHGHSGFAEGQGSAESFFVFARDDAKLDFVSLSEHDIWTDDAEWAQLQRLTSSYSKEGEFISFLGYEWTAPRAYGGHREVLFRSADEKRVSTFAAPTQPELYAALNERIEPGGALVVPHAHEAADWTQSDPQLERLVEVYSMHGTFEWFANLYLQNGFEVGFIAASDDHRSRPGLAHGAASAPLAQFGGLAAVRAARKRGDAIWEALRERSVYATSGERILLDATLNGRPMGSRQDDSEQRRLRVRVSGTAPIEELDIVRNGRVVFSRNFVSRPPESHSWLLIGFESPSDVLGESQTDLERDNPRPYRVWRGTIGVRGARLAGARGIGLDNLYLEGVEIENDGRVGFHVETRGRRDVILLELEDAGGDAELDFELREAREYGFEPMLVRPPATTPPTAFTIALSALKDGSVEETLSIGEHVDRVRVQSINPGAPLDQELEFVDLDEIAPGDYYYARVRQIDGARAWSSPFWVGSR